MMLKILTLTIAAIILWIVIGLTRKEKLTFKYAFAWILVGLLAILGVVFDQGLFQIARWLGFQLPSNFIFFTLLTVFVFLSLMLTIFLSQQNNRNDTMAHKIAFLEYEIEELKKKVKKEAKDDEKK